MFDERFVVVGSGGDGLEGLPDCFSQLFIFCDGQCWAGVSVVQDAAGRTGMRGRLLGGLRSAFFANGEFECFRRVDDVGGEASTEAGEFLVDGGKACFFLRRKVGAFLSEDERLALRRELTAALAEMR